MRHVLVGLSVTVLAACGGVEVRIDETQGVPPVTGTASVNLGSYTCGQPITASGYTVTTTKVSGGCQFAFDQDVTVIKASDYASMPGFKGASNLVQRVELTVKKLAFTDGSGAALDLNTRVTSATLSVNGQQVADKATLASLPTVVSLSGAALAPLKTQIDARVAATAHVTVVAVLPDTPAPPSTLNVDYDAQPAIIVGTGSIKLP